MEAFIAIFFLPFKLNVIRWRHTIVFYFILERV